MKYIITLSSGATIKSNSRDSKKFVRDYGVNRAIVCNKSGKVISAAERDANNHIYNIIW